MGEQCKAKSRRTGERCRSGRSLVGAAASNYKTGRYSRLLPKGLATKYAAALDDPEWLALKDEIALSEARLGEALERLNEHETPALLKLLDTEYGRLRTAIDAGNAAGVTRAMHALDDLFAKRTAVAGLWAEVDALIEQRRRLSDTEQKRLVAMQQMISSEQAMVLIDTLLGIIKTHVTDRKALAAISTDIVAIVGASAVTRSAGGTKS
jgi:hypothetical protein